MTDKEWVIISLTIIGVAALVVMGVNAENAITAIISGLCGIAVGQQIK